MGASRFQIVFEQLAKQATNCGDDLYVTVESLRSEMEGIEELRRLSLEMRDTEPATYTAT